MEAIERENFGGLLRNLTPNLSPYQKKLQDTLLYFEHTLVRCYYETLFSYLCYGEYLLLLHKNVWETREGELYIVIALF